MLFQRPRMKESYLLERFVFGFYQERIYILLELDQTKKKVKDQ